MAIKGKVVLLGAAGVGKSALLNRLSSDQFYDDQMPTIGAAYASVVVQKQPLHTIGIWDTAGQERYSALAPMYYRNSHIGVIVYDITSRTSYERAWAWIETLSQSQPEMKVLLLGSKLDLGSERDIPTVEAAAAAARRGLPHQELSSKSGEGISRLREWLSVRSNELIPQPKLQLPSPPLRRDRIESCC